MEPQSFVAYCINSGAWAFVGYAIPLLIARVRRANERIDERDQGNDDDVGGEDRP